MSRAQLKFRALYSALLSALVGSIFFSLGVRHTRGQTAPCSNNLRVGVKEAEEEKTLRSYSAGVSVLQVPLSLSLCPAVLESFSVLTSNYIIN